MNGHELHFISDLRESEHTRSITAHAKRNCLRLKSTGTIAYVREHVMVLCNDDVRFLTLVKYYY